MFKLVLNQDYSGSMVSVKTPIALLDGLNLFANIAVLVCNFRLMQISAGLAVRNGTPGQLN